MAKCTHVLRTHKVAIHSRAWQHSVFEIVQEPTWCKLLPRNSAAAMSSSGHSSEVRRWFRVSAGRRAVSSSEVNCRVPAAYTVPNFIEPSLWPPNSPDLNPVDYAVWGAMQHSVYRIPISNLDDLKDRVRTCCRRVLTNRSSTSPLISGVTDWRHSNEWWTHWTVVLNTVSA